LKVSFACFQWLDVVLLANRKHKGKYFIDVSFSVAYIIGMNKHFKETDEPLEPEQLREWLRMDMMRMLDNGHIEELREIYSWLGSELRKLELTSEWKEKPKWLTER